MANIEKYESVQMVTDRDGNIIEEKTIQKTKRILKVTEPEYIKLYTQTWQSKTKNGNQAKNEIPISYRHLFVELAARMEFCDTDDLEHSQLVKTGNLFQEEIMRALGWTSRDSLQKGLKALCDCHAIRRVSRGMYQINPKYAAKGQWKYNPRISQSNLEEFVKYFEQQIAKEERKKAEKIRKELMGKSKPGKPVTEKTETEEPVTTESPVEKVAEPTAEVQAEKEALDLDNWHD